MDTTVERRIGDVIVRIDRLLCVGFGDCIDEAPEVFELDDEQIAVFRAGGEPRSRASLIKACAACPVDALSVHDLEGELLAEGE